MPDELSPRHLAVRVAEIAAVVALVALAISAVPGLDEVRTRLQDADPVWVAALAVAEIGSCAGYLLVFRSTFCSQMVWGLSYDIAMAELKGDRMPEQTTGAAAEASGVPAGSGLDSRFPGKYLSLTTYKRDGSAVATPVWFVINDGRLLVQTREQSFKVGRIRRNPAVTIAPCTARGQLRGDPTQATAEILPDGELAHVGELMARKYRVDRILILPIYRVVQRLRGGHDGGTEIGIAITPRSAPGAARGG